MRKIIIISFLSLISFNVFCQVKNENCDSNSGFNKYVVSTIEGAHKRLYKTQLKELNRDYLVEIEFNIDSSGFLVSCESTRQNNPTDVVDYIRTLFLSHKDEKWLFDDTSTNSRRIHCFIYLKCLKLSNIERLKQIDEENEMNLKNIQISTTGPKSNDFNANSCFIFLSY